MASLLNKGGVGHFLQIENQFSRSENIIRNFDSTIRKNDSKIFGGLSYCFYVCIKQLKQTKWQLK